MLNMEFRMYDGKNGKHKFCVVSEEKGRFVEEKCIDDLTIGDIKIGTKFLNLVDISVNIEWVDEKREND